MMLFPMQRTIKTLNNLLLLLCLAAGAFAQQAAVVPESPDTAADQRLAAFEKVWSVVNEKHFDPTFGGVDWAAMRVKYRPRAMAAASDEEFNSVLRAMIGELHLSHFSIYSRDFDVKAAGAGNIGVELKMIGRQAVVERVRPDSAAAAAGIRRGFVLTAIEGKSTAALLAPLERSMAERKLSDRMKMLYRDRTLTAMLSGTPKTAVKAAFAEGRKRPRTFSVIREATFGEMSQPLGNFPAQPVEFESRLLDGNIGYIRFNMWIIPQMAKIRGAIKDLRNARGIIFDLRGNPGGIGGMAPGVAGLLTDKRLSLGAMNSRDGSIKFIAYPQDGAFLGPVVIITDHGTGSTSEVFAAGLQEAGRSAVVGETSAGAVLPSVFEKLPTGATFQYPVADYRTPSNILVEGRGVIPDRTVYQTVRSLLAGRDLQLEAAIREISKRYNAAN